MKISFIIRIKKRHLHKENILLNIKRYKEEHKKLQIFRFHLSSFEQKKILQFWREENKEQNWRWKRKNSPWWFVVRSLNINYLLAVLSSGGIEWLYEIRRVSEEKCITGSTADHTEHSEPHIGQGLRWKPSVSYAEHVRHGFEKCPRVLFQPKRILENITVE